MHRPGRRIDFSVRQENIIRIIQSNESRVSLIRAVFPIPRCRRRRPIVEHGQSYPFLIYIWDRSMTRATRSPISRFLLDSLLS